MQYWAASGFIDGVEAASSTTVELTGVGSMPAAFVTPGLFSFLGVPPMRGRTFDGVSESGELVISEVLWRSHFAADPTVLGRTLSLGERPYTIVGIMPAAFRFPTPDALIWMRLPPSLAGQPVTIYGRVAPGRNWPDLAERLATIAEEVAYIPAAYRSTPKISRLEGPSLPPEFISALWLLVAAALLLAVVLAANSIAILLAGMMARQREFATYLAIGARPARLVYQVALEHSVLGLASLAGGHLVAWGLVSAAPAIIDNRSLNVIDLDARALMVASVAGLATILVAGVVPAIIGTRTDGSILNRHASERPPARAMHLSTGRWLAVLQLSVAMGFMVTATLMVRSFAKLSTQERGIRLDGILRVQILNIDHAFGGAFSTNVPSLVAQEAESWPEVERVALSREIPPLPHGAGGDARIDGVNGYRVTPEFFQLYGISIFEGRTLSKMQDAGEIVVSERFALQNWPTEGSIGKVIRLTSGSPRTVVGVARDIRLPALDGTVDLPEFYVPLGSGSRTLYASLKCRGSCPTVDILRHRVRRLHSSLDVRLAVDGDEIYRRQLTLPRELATVSTMFAIIALGAACVGTYSILALIVRGRRQEFAIRQALGAPPGAIRGIVFRHATSIAGAGLSGGIVIGFIMARLLASLQYGVTVWDPSTWTAAIGVLGCAIIAAALRPCLEASSANPLELLRRE